MAAECRTVGLATRDQVDVIVKHVLTCRLAAIHDQVHVPHR